MPMSCDPIKLLYLAMVRYGWKKKIEMNLMAWTGILLYHSPFPFQTLNPKLWLLLHIIVLPKWALFSHLYLSFISLYLIGQRWCRMGQKYKRESWSMYFAHLCCLSWQNKQFFGESNKDKQHTLINFPFYIFDPPYTTFVLPNKAR